MRMSKNRYFLPHFGFPWGRPWGNHAKCCIDGKGIRCLQIVSQHSNRKCKNSPFSRTTAHIFVSSGDAPATITQYVAWMERQFSACQTPRSMYPSIFNSFPVIEPQVQKIAVFMYSSTHFCFPWRRHCDYHAIRSVDGKTIQCLPNPSQHVLSIFNGFRVIRCLSQCVSRKIAIFT